MNNHEISLIKKAENKRSCANFLKKDFVKYKYIYLMILPTLLYFLIFHYGPMYGAIIAFKDYTPRDGFLGSEWVGLKHFVKFFNGMYFWRLLQNTLLINSYELLFGFPAPIILALMINEVRSSLFKRTVQTVTYLPHFISIMVICGIIIDFTSLNGIVNHFIALFGGEKTILLQRPELFKMIYVSTNIWQKVGWESIIYLAALAAINPQLYEAATIDGANRWKQTFHITLPGIMSTITIILIMKIGQMMNIGFEKIMLLYNPLTYETADVISTFVYRQGIQQTNYSFSTAVELFNSVINFVLLISANTLSKTFSDTSLW